MRVALVYDRVNKFGGAERVLLHLHKIFPDAPLYTLVHNHSTAKWSGSIKVVPTFFNKLGILRTRHELLTPFAPIAFEQFDFTGFDLVISITSSDAKSIVTKPETFHLCYCLTPPRYLWQLSEQYGLPKILLSIFRERDKYFSIRPDAYIAISREVQKRISDSYNLRSEIVYPSINFDFFSKYYSEQKSDYYLFVGRLVDYKKVNLLLETFKLSKRKLVIVGVGRQIISVSKFHQKNIKLTGFVDDHTLAGYYANAKALIAPQYEDFGLTSLEAQATGTPVIAYRKGGSLETVISNRTGIFFEEQTIASLQSALHKFETNNTISSQQCKNNASRFKEDSFIGNFSDKLELLWQRYRRKMSL